MSKMKKAKNIAFLSVLVGLVAATSTLSTIAWYTGSSHLQVSNFNIKFSNKELEVSVDNINYKDRLDNRDLPFVDKFIPVSSMFSSSWIDAKQENPTFKKGFSQSYLEKQDYVLASDYDDASSGYMSKLIYLRCTSDGIATIDTQKTTFLALNKENEQLATKLARKYPHLSHDEILKNLNDVVKSLRLSLLVLGDEGDNDNLDYQYYIIDPYKENVTYLGGILDNDLDGFYDYYENREALFGEIKNISDTSLFYGMEEIKEVDKTSCFVANTKEGISHIDLPSSMENGLVVQQEQSIALKDAEEIKINLSSYVPKRIVLSLYLEGWDKDNTNLNMYSHFAMDLAFKLVDQQ